MVKTIYEIIKEDIDEVFNADLIYKKVKEKRNADLTENAILQSFDLLTKMRIIEMTSEPVKEFRLTDLGHNVPIELVEKTVRIYMERNMCQDSRFTRS